MADGNDSDAEPPSKRARLQTTLQSVAADLKCSISGELVIDPVLTVDGQLYERASIERWLTANDTSPSTGLKLSSKTLIPCFVARNSVTQLVEGGVLPVDEQRQWLVRRGLLLISSDSAASKKCFEKAVVLGDATAKYHLGCMLIREAAAAGVPEAIAFEARGPKKTASQMKADGRSALEAKAAGCPGTEIFALCNEYKFIGSFADLKNVGGEEGQECVTKEGRFGVMYAKDRDNQDPWIIKGVHDSEAWEGEELVSNVRPLRW